MNSTDRENILLKLKNQKKTKIIVILCGIIIAAAGIAVAVVIGINKHKKGIIDDIDIDVNDIIGSRSEAELVENNTTIEDIVGISELQTLNYDYQAICRVYSETDHVTPVYYIAYDATVTLGIRTEDIEVDYGDDDDKVITVVLPRVGILNTVVNAGTLEYLFADTSYNNSNTSVQAQARCEEDLINRVREDTKMFEYAKDNTEAEIRALTEPLVQQFYPEYELEIIWREG